MGLLVLANALFLGAWLPSARAETLLLRSTPRAVAYVDGERKGQTPIRLDLAAGRHHIELRHPKMLTWTSHLILPPRSQMTLGIRLERRGSEGTVAAREEDNPPTTRLDEPLPRQSTPEPLPKSSGLLIARSVPSGASVYQGSRLLGRTPLLVNISMGTHRLRFELEGYNVAERMINIQPSISSRLLVRLQGGNRLRKGNGDTAIQQDGQGSQTQLLVLSNPPGAKVILNGRNMGLTPIVSAGLAPGVYSLRVQAKGFSPYIRTLRLAEGQELRLKVLLIPRSKKR